MNGSPAASRVGALDATPALVCIVASMLALLTIPNLRPERLIVDRGRYYLIVGAVTILAWTAIGYLIVSLFGSKRPLMVVLTFTSMTMLPLAVGPLLGWVNSTLDHGPGSVVDLRVSGYTHHGRTGVVGVRFQATGDSFPEVEAKKMTVFFPQPTPTVGTAFRAEYREGAFGVRWISKLQAIGPN